jgi:predicted lipid-binding transport protein (Tim44 family)
VPNPVRTAPDEGVLHESTAHGPVPVPPPAAPPGTMEQVGALWDDLSHLLHDQFELAALETQRAAKSLAAMLVWGLAAGLLLVTAWLGIMAAIVLFLIDLGLAASLAILLVVVLTLVGAATCALVIKKKSRYLRYPATVRSLKPQNSGRTEES